MRLVHTTIILFAMFCISWSCYAANQKYSTCELLSAIIQLGSASPKGDPKDYDAIYGAQPPELIARLKQAELAALAAFAKANETRSDPTRRHSLSSSFQIAWVKYLRQKMQPVLIGTEENPVPLKKLSGMGQVYELNYDGKRRVFRGIYDAIDTVEALEVRNSVAGSLLNDYFELSVVPKNAPAIVNGQVGVIRDYIEGWNFHKSTAIRFESALAKALREKKISAASFDNASALMFLISNEDVTAPNILVDRDSQVRIVDLGVSFYGHEMPQELHTTSVFDAYPMGFFLPRRYSKKFVKKLKELDREKIEGMLLDHLSNDEIGTLLFNREIMLQDVALNPDIAKN
jgi:hypothetical protein